MNQSNTQRESERAGEVRKDGPTEGVVLMVGFIGGDIGVNIKEMKGKQPVRVTLQWRTDHAHARKLLELLHFDEVRLVAIPVQPPTNPQPSKDREGGEQGVGD